VSLTLASINLHCGLTYQGKPFSVKSAIAAVDADVVVVQENWGPVGGPSLAAEVAADCGYPAYAELDMVTATPLADLQVVRHAPAEVGSWGLAIMSRRPWSRVLAVPLGVARGDVVGKRYAQVAEIPWDTGATLRVVNVHFTHRLASGPAQLRRLIAAIGTGAIPTVIAGDLNMCRPTVYLARPYRPVVRGRTWPAHRSVAQLDHILAGPGVRASAPTIGPETGSDHRSVRAAIDLEPRP
jgi:endonuclease/exonuclease/phosphatase family metal-dependent hydrolase